MHGTYARISLLPGVLSLLLLMTLTSCGTRYITLGDSDCGTGFYAGVDGRCLIWGQSVIPYYLHTSMASDFTADQIQEIRDAFEARVPGMFSEVRFAYMGTTGVGKDVRTINVVYAVSDGSLPVSTQARNTNIIDAAGTVITNFTLELNTKDFRFSKDPEWRKVHLRTVLLHEIGHALGSRHQIVPTQVMYPTLAYSTKKGGDAGYTLDDLLIFGKNYALLAAIQTQLAAALRSGLVVDRTSTTDRSIASTQEASTVASGEVSCETALLQPVGEEVESATKDSKTESKDLQPQLL